MWTLSKDDVVTKPRLDIQSKKSMFEIMWNPSNFYIVDRLPNDTKMNSDHFVTNAVILLKQAIFPRGRALHQKQLVVHLDNSTVHTNRVSTDWREEHGMHHTPHLYHSPDLTSSDFYLSPTIKEKL
jgi:hypothetical protein